MIKALYDNGTGKILLVSSGEHQRVGHVFATNGHLRDMWYHSPIVEDPNIGPALFHHPIKVMDITDDWSTVVAAFTKDNSLTIVDEILEAVAEYHIEHPPAPPVDTSNEPVTGYIKFG